MASRRAALNEGTPAPCIRTYRKHTWEPSDKCAEIPGGTFGYRPAPFNVRSPQTQPTLEAALVTTPNDAIEECEELKDPEIVELAAPNGRARRDVTGLNQASSKRTVNPSIDSKCRTPQSEISIGIFDCYQRQHSSLHETFLPPPTMLRVDPAMDKFDFGLTPQTTTPRADAGHSSQKLAATTTVAGAERDEKLTYLSSPPLSLNRIPVRHKQAYSLFPKVDGIPRSVHNQSNIGECVSPPQGGHKDGRSPTVLAHEQPDPSYQPRKESLSSSIRSRKDSFTSYRSNQCAPQRISSSGSTAITSTTQRAPTVSATFLSVSPPQRVWSEDTIISPMVASGAMPRTSFGSLLDANGRCRDGNSYPACFFEVDDEQVPLWRKFAWKRSISPMHEREQKQGRGRFIEKPTFGQWLRRVVICGGCSSARR